MKTAALVLAAGKSLRFKGSRPKQFEKLLGTEIIVRSVRIFLDSPHVDVTALVIEPGRYRETEKLFLSHGINDVLITDGGQSRQESSLLGLMVLKSLDIERVLIHDSARPLFRKEYLGEILERVCPGTGVVAGRPARDTIYRYRNDAVTLLERQELWLAETPQCFFLEEILKAHTRATRIELSNATDDAQLFVASGGNIRFFHCQSPNVKITESHDLKIAEAILDSS